MKLIQVAVLLFFLLWSCKDNSLPNRNSSKAVDIEQAEKFYSDAKAKLEYNDHRGAIKDYRAAIRIDQNFYKAYMDLGYSLGQIGKTTQAVLAYADASAVKDISPKQKSSALLSKGLSYLEYQRKDMNDSACECFSEAAALVPNPSANLQITMHCQQ